MLHDTILHYILLYHDMLYKPTQCSKETFNLLEFLDCPVKRPYEAL